jgi:molybdopterin-containing oxidoreductase family membrane subunit
MAKSDPNALHPVYGEPPLILGGRDFRSITETVAAPLERKPPLGWYLVLAGALGLLGLLGVHTAWLFWEGIGIWGLNNPVGWGFAIVNFVFWVGIGHAGTLISAILFLFRQKWRTSINRAAEAMTIFAVMCALIFPGIHVGRIWVAYWMMPFPNQMAMWPNFHSPLIWDVFAVSIYGTVSALFWYLGLIPDLATFRDRAGSKIRRMAYGIFALGWRSSNRHWQHYERAYLLLAALATPLVLSVHSIVSMDFATSQLPGWHTTIFPPYFVAGAIFSGFAMVLTLMIICRSAFGMQDIITLKHFDSMAKILLLTGSMVGYAYIMEFFIAWYGGNPYEFYIHHVDLRQHRHVVRALRHRRHLAAPRLPALVVGLLPRDLLGLRGDARQLRPVLHDVLPVRPLPADGGDGGGQGRAAAGRPALLRRG